MKRLTVALASIVASGFVLAGAAALIPVRHACAAEPRQSYSEDIAPIFRGWCVSCHQQGGQGFNASGLDLTSYEGLMKGTKYGPMVLAGKPDESNLIRLINGEAKIQMPFKHKPLPACVRQNIWSWIFEGAKND
jgi:mono/diheme cytochrome c family protein